MSRGEPWSPSAAREAARAALRRYRTEPQKAGDLERECVELLRNDDAFATPEALVLATWIYVPHEVRAHLDHHCQVNSIGPTHEALRVPIGRARGWLP